MSVDVSHITRWTPWRDVSSSETPLTDYVPSDLSAAVKAKMLAVTPGSMIAIRAWGLGSDNDQAEIIISAWMDPEKDAGPGQRLWRGDLILGAHEFSAAKALYTGPVSTTLTVARTWREVDTWDKTGGTGPFDAIGDVVQITGGGHCIALFPTFGYTHLLAEILDIGGGSEATRVALMAREIARGRVIHKTF